MQHYNRSIEIWSHAAAKNYKHYFSLSLFSIPFSPTKVPGAGNLKPVLFHENTIFKHAGTNSYCSFLSKEQEAARVLGFLHIHRGLLLNYSGSTFLADNLFPLLNCYTPWFLADNTISIIYLTLTSFLRRKHKSYHLIQKFVYDKKYTNGQRLHGLHDD